MSKRLGYSAGLGCTMRPDDEGVASERGVVAAMTDSLTAMMGLLMPFQPRLSSPLGEKNVDGCFFPSMSAVVVSS